MSETQSIQGSPAETALADAFAQRAATPSQAAAWSRFAEQGLPHRRVEAWKWTDLRATTIGDMAGLTKPGALAASTAPVASVQAERPPREAMPALAGAFTEAVRVFTLADGDTLSLTGLAEGGHDMVAVTVPEGARCRVVERYPVGGGAFANIAVLYRLNAGASLERVVIAPGVEGGVVTVTAGVELDAEASFRQVSIALGAAAMRLETRVDIDGPGAEATLNGVTLLAGERHADQTTLAVHAAPNAVTRETFRTVATQAAQGVFQGKIKVDRLAQHTDAEMDHGALILSERAGVNAKPELEIYADDVQCAHGNAIGALDENAVFYLRQRGVPAARARALLTRAFIAEALEGLEEDALRTEIEALVEDWMETHL